MNLEIFKSDAVTVHIFVPLASMTSLTPPVPAPLSGPFVVGIKRLEGSRSQPPNPTSFEPLLPSPLQINAEFGTVYIGDKFRAAVHVSATETVSDVAVSLCMRTSMPDIILMKSEIMEQLSGNDGRDFLIEHEVSTPGLHQIVCSIDYIEIDSSLQSVFTRVFKFQVQPPFSLTHYVSNTLARSYVGVEVTNLVQASVNIRSVQFLLNSSTLSPITAKIVIEDQFNSDVVLNESECFSSTSIVTWNQAFCDDCLPSPLSGRFLIGWSQINGDETCFFKSTLINLLSVEDIKLAVVAAPVSARLETVFTIKLLITNASTIDLDDIRVEFVKERLSYLRPSGPIVQSLGNLPQRSNLGYTVSVVGLATGVHCLNGIRLSCPSTGRTYDFDQVCHIEIVH